MSEWISVEDRLSDGGVVMGWVKLSGGWTARSGITNVDGTFWMNGRVEVYSLEALTRPAARKELL